MCSFIYALPAHTSLQQQAAVARGLYGLFPDIEFEHREGAFLTGDIIPISGGTHPTEPEGVVMDAPPRLLVMEVKTAFAGLLVEALAEPRSSCR